MALQIALALAQGVQVVGAVDIADGIGKIRRIKLFGSKLAQQLVDCAATVSVGPEQRFVDECR